jgi:multicomponent Na+:H+ antiporter subunit D
VIPTFVALPLAVAFVLPLIGRWRMAASDWLANLTVFTLAAMALLSIGADEIYHMGGWATPLGIDLRLDALAVLLLVAINAVAALVCLYSAQYMRRYTARHRYYGLFLFLVAGANGAVLAGDLFNLYVLMEITVVASYALVAFGGEREGLEAAFKYAVLGTLSSAAILVGIAIIYGVTGTLNMAHIASRIDAQATGPSLAFAAALLLCGFGLKAAVVPFHAWLPDAHASAPAPVSAMLSGVVVKAIGIYVLARLLYNVLGAGDDLLAALRWLGAISMVVGALLATAQWDFKRLLAYSTISQVGYIVLGLGLGTPLGVVGALYHLLNHAAFKTLLFLNAGAVEHATGTRDMNELGGLQRAMPVTGVTTLVASLSIAGIPPFNGFWSKLIIIIACVQAGFAGLAGLAALVSVVTLAYQLKLQHHVFLAGPPAQRAELGREPALMAATMIVLAIACAGLSLLAIGGLENPFLVGPAQTVLLAGRFGF